MSPDYCRECEQAISRKAKLVETIPALAAFTGLMFWLMIPIFFGIDLRLLNVINGVLGENYQAYTGYQELSSLISFALIPYLVTARIRGLYRRGLRTSWGLFPFVFWPRLHWVKPETKPPA